jgi:tetratricopeptide (TPR) repeat protein
MAPEQAAADPNTDHRADIYAFGAMAYELLVGHPPFQAGTPARLLAAHMSETPRDPRTLRSDTPVALAELILGCLAKDPEDRPQQANDLLRVLETVTTSGTAPAAPAILAGHRRREGLRWMRLRTEALERTTPSAVNRLGFALDTASGAAYAGDAALARSAAARGLARYPVESMPAGDRPWERLSYFAATAADPALARQALAGFERDLAALEYDAAGVRAVYSAHVALAEGKWEEAVGLLHQADARTSLDRRYAMVQVARAYDLAGWSDSAIVYYEKFLGSRDPLPTDDAHWRARAHRWLGALYEARGNSRQAIEQYGRFLGLWKNADPSLQPQVEEVRGLVGRLRAKAG